jgi:hypothetical protein
MAPRLQPIGQPTRVGRLAGPLPAFQGDETSLRHGPKWGAGPDFVQKAEAGMAPLPVGG